MARFNCQATSVRGYLAFSLLLTVTKSLIDHGVKWLLRGVRLDLGRDGPHVGCYNMFAAALSLR